MNLRVSINPSQDSWSNMVLKSNDSTFCSYYYFWPFFFLTGAAFFLALLDYWFFFSYYALNYYYFFFCKYYYSLSNCSLQLFFNFKSNFNNIFFPSTGNYFTVLSLSKNEKYLLDSNFCFMFTLQLS